MRIISGEFKGKQIVPDGRLSLRPTTDFAKEGLFNILSNSCDIALFDVLDLFSGSGSISYEFASRGCRSIHSVEIDSRHAAFIRTTADKLGFSQIRVIRNDAFRFLNICKVQYDIVFADPPFDMSKTEKLPSLILDRNMLKSGGILVLEHSKKHDFKGHDFFYDHRQYGNVHFSFFRGEK